MVRERASRVRCAFSATDPFSFSGDPKPQVTMLGFRRQPSQKMSLSLSAFTTEAKTFSDTFWHSSIECQPSARTSGSTMGTSPLLWQILAYRARPHAFSAIARLLGPPLTILMTALHLANLQPSPQYSLAIAQRLSRPLVKVQSGSPPARAAVPLSTLMPGTIPLEAANSMKVLPSISCMAVSSWKMMPDMQLSSPSAPMSIQRYCRLCSAVFQRPMLWNFFGSEVGLQSAARMPLPGAMILLAVAASSALNYI